MQRITAFTLCLLLLTMALPGVLAQTPEVPEGDLAVLPYKLPQGQSYPVYSGPGTDYLRAGDNATLSTNDGVQVFGQLDGRGPKWMEKWVLIQYDTGHGRYRFGYIQLPLLLSLQSSMTFLWETLPWEELRVFSTPTPLTDDPLGQRQPLLELPEGSQALRLGRMGEWAYVEVQQDAVRARGFVPESTLAPAAWRDEGRPFDLRASSWAPMRADYATTRSQYAREGPFELGQPFPNAWLRLDSTESRAALETLSDFRVVEGRATCGSMPVPLIAWGVDMEEPWDENAQEAGERRLHFVPKAGFSRAALDIRLDQWESIANVTIACTRTLLDGRSERITLPLRDVPLDMGYPQGGAVFTAHRLTAFRPNAEDMQPLFRYAEGSITLGTALQQGWYQPMPQVPEAILSLPYDTEECDLYLLQGTITKSSGPFGVYDVTFALQNPPPGVFLAARQECGVCDEIDAFDLIADQVYTPNGLWEGYDGYHGKMEEGLKGSFAILLLVNRQLYPEEIFVNMAKELDIQVTFSGEKWNMSYEQHYVTTAIGPRSHEKMRMEEVVRGEGLLTRLPD